MTVCRLTEGRPPATRGGEGRMKSREMGAKDASG